MLSTCSLEIEGDTVDFVQFRHESVLLPLRNNEVLSLIRLRGETYTCPMADHTTSEAQGWSFRLSKGIIMTVTFKILIVRVVL